MAGGTHTLLNANNKRLQQTRKLFCYKINLIRLQDNLSVLLAAGAARTALSKNGPQRIFIDMIFQEKITCNLVEK